MGHTHPVENDIIVMDTGSRQFLRVATVTLQLLHVQQYSVSVGQLHRRIKGFARLSAALAVLAKC